MAPNPIMLPRKINNRYQKENEKALAKYGLTRVLLSVSFVVLLVATLPWAQRWFYSGCAIESLLLIYGARMGTHLLPAMPLWTLLASLNLIYALASTSWLLYGVFAALCYPLVMLTCLIQFNVVSTFARRRLRSLLRELHFTRDKIALFNLPALEIDTDVAGLFVVRGVTISLSSLTIVAHGVELGLKLADDMELALYADEVNIKLFRRIDIGDVFGNLKGGPQEMTFGDIEEVERDDDSMFEANTGLLRAATAGAEGLQPPKKPTRPSLPREFTAGIDLKDSTPKAGLGNVTKLSPDDTQAEKQYHSLLNHIKETSHVYQSRKQVEESTGENAFTVTSEKDLRAAVCAKLQEMPSVPHPPSRSVRVTTLQKMSSPAMRRFMHRLPFLLRLLLMPLSYFHPLRISSISAAGSGQWLTSLLRQKVFKNYATNDAEIRRLERRISTWLADANFCVELCDIDGLGQVPLSTTFDVVTYLKFADIMAYRTVPNSGTIQQVIRLGGADATFSIPSYLLPHHEHILPDIPTEEDDKEQEEAVEEADGKPKTFQAEKELEKLRKDETEVIMSVHASLPACLDQSMLNFVAALVKATKIIEMEKEVDDLENGADSPTKSTFQSPSSAVPGTDPSSPPFPALSPVSTFSSTTTLDEDVTPGAPSKRSAFKSFARGIQQNIKTNVTSESIKELARDLHQQTKDGMKKAVVGGFVNDRWIAKMVGKIAAQLERAQGDVGYSGGIPVALGPYRGTGDFESKILP